MGLPEKSVQSLDNSVDVNAQLLRSLLGDYEKYVEIGDVETASKILQLISEKAKRGSEALLITLTGGKKQERVIVPIHITYQI